MAQPVTPLRLDYPVNVLTSFHYFRRRDMGALHRAGLRIIGDSGAYSAASLGTTVDRDAYYAWVARWQHVLHWCAGLDVIGDDDATYRNWLAAPADLQLVPTVHYGVEPSAIDKYAEAGATLIGLGGMVPHKSQPMKLLRWAAQVMRYARDQHPQVRFHGWGVTHPQLIMNLPWWSVDSSGWGAAYRYGRAVLIDPTTGARVNATLDGRDMARHATLLRQHYGVDWTEVSESRPENRSQLVRLTARSMQHWEAFLQKRWSVSPPSRLRGIGVGPHLSYVMPNVDDSMSLSVGPHLHFADTGILNLRDLEQPIQTGRGIT